MERRRDQLTASTLKWAQNLCEGVLGPFLSEDVDSVEQQRLVSGGQMDERLRAYRLALDSTNA